MIQYKELAPNTSAPLNLKPAVAQYSGYDKTKRNSYPVRRQSGSTNTRPHTYAKYISDKENIYLFSTEANQKECFKYNMPTETFVKLPNCTNQLQSGCIVSVGNNFIYAFIGKDINIFNKEKAIWESRLYVSDPTVATDTFYQTSAIEKNGFIYMFGVSASSNVINNIFIFNIELKTYEAFPIADRIMSPLCIFEFESNIYLYAKKQNQNYFSLYKFNIETKTISLFFENVNKSDEVIGRAAFAIPIDDFILINDWTSSSGGSQSVSLINMKDKKKIYNYADNSSNQAFAMAIYNNTLYEVASDGFAYARDDFAISCLTTAEESGLFLKKGNIIKARGAIIKINATQRIEYAPSIEEFICNEDAFYIVEEPFTIW